MSNPPQYDLQRQSARLRSLVTVLIFALASLLLLERFGWTVTAMAKGGAASVTQRVGVELIAAIPEAIYLLALWWIRSALVSFVAGDFFAPVLTRMLRRVGMCLVAGAVMNVAVVPSLDRLLGAGPGYWLAFDLEGCTLAAVGLSLTILARVLDRARELKTELDAIF